MAFNANLGLCALNNTTQHILHYFSGRTLFIFEALLAQMAFRWPIIRVVLHVIIEVGFFVECLRTMRASEKKMKLLIHSNYPN